jgi:hypothetical protein
MSHTCGCLQRPRGKRRYAYVCTVYSSSWTRNLLMGSRTPLIGAMLQATDDDARSEEVIPTLTWNWASCSRWHQCCTWTDDPTPTPPSAVSSDTLKKTTFTYIVSCTAEAVGSRNRIPLGLGTLYVLCLFCPGFATGWSPIQVVLLNDCRQHF